MAPEIKEGKTYDGRSIDIFSTGVILWIIVQGIFPFQEAKKDDYYYKLLVAGDYNTYWKKTGSEDCSDEFKDLMLKMLNYDPSKRPTISELKAHPWMQKPIIMKQVGNEIKSALQEARSNSTVDTSQMGGQSSRGVDSLELIR